MLVQNIEAGNQNQALDVVPGYYLVWYNRERQRPHNHSDYAVFLCTKNLIFHFQI